MFSDNNKKKKTFNFNLILTITICTIPTAVGAVGNTAPDLSWWVIESEITERKEGMLTARVMFETLTKLLNLKLNTNAILHTTSQQTVESKFLFVLKAKSLVQGDPKKKQNPYKFY